MRVESASTGYSRFSRVLLEWDGSGTSGRGKLLAFHEVSARSCTVRETAAAIGGCKRPGARHALASIGATRHICSDVPISSRISF